MFSENESDKTIWKGNLRNWSRDHDMRINNKVGI